MILAALGAALAVVVRREVEAGAGLSTVLWAIGGAAVGYGIARLWR